MFFHVERKIRIQRLNGKTEQNLLNLISLELNVEVKTFRNGHFLETKVLVRETEKCLVNARDLKMEI